MAHAYTPGLKVLQHSKVKKERRLPIKGEVHKNVGDIVEADEIVAETKLPGNVHMLKVANRLNIAPGDIIDVLSVNEGDSVKKGELIAETQGLFGFFKTSFQSRQVFYSHVHKCKWFYLWWFLINFFAAKI